MENGYILKQINIKSHKEYNNIISELNKSYPFSDIFICDASMYINWHYHTDDEVRLIIDGECYFKFKEDEVIKAIPGTFIKIPKGVLHSFECSQKTPVKALRYFSNNENWDAKFT